MKQIVSMILAAALTVILSLSLVGCGESESEATTGDPTVTETAGVSEIPDSGTEEFESEAEENMREDEEEIPEFADKQLRSVTQYKVNGDVVSEIEYSENGKILGEYQYNGKDYWTEGTQYQYNEYGLIQKVEYSSKYNGDGYQEIGKEEYYYDDNGNLIREIIWDDNDIPNSYHMKTVIEYDYDENNNCIASYDLEGHAAGYTMVLDEFSRRDNPTETFEYDDNGRLISTSTYNGNGALNELTNYAYDNNGNVLTEKFYTGTNLSLSESIEYSYNADNLLVSVETYNGDDTLQQITEYVYDNDGNMLSETTNNYNGNVRSEFTYKSTGEIITYCNKTFWRNGELKTYVETTVDGDTYEVEYDYCGNMISKISYSSPDTIDSRASYEYTYDEAGNKLTEKIVSNGTTTEYTYVNDYY